MVHVRILAAVAALLASLEHAKGGPLNQDAPGKHPAPTAAGAYTAGSSLATANDLALSTPLAVDAYDLPAFSSSIHRTETYAHDLIPLGELPAAKRAASGTFSENLNPRVPFNAGVGTGSSIDPGYTFKFGNGIVADPDEELDESLDPVGLGLIALLCAAALCLVGGDAKA